MTAFYLSAGILLPALHESGLILPHDHCVCAGIRYGSENTNTIAADTDACHSKRHGTECPICHFKNHLSGIKYYSASICPTIFAPVSFDASINLHIPPSEILIRRSARAPPSIQSAYFHSTFIRGQMENTI